MTIYTITIINQRHGWVAHVENHINIEQAEKRFLHLEKKWKKDNNFNYLVEIHTTQIVNAQQ